MQLSVAAAAGAGRMMELIVGNERIAAERLRAVPGGVEAVLAGAALLRLLDATFRGAGTIELFGQGAPRRLDVTDIRMAGGSTCVTLRDHGALRLN